MALTSQFLSAVRLALKTIPSSATDLSVTQEGDPIAPRVKVTLSGAHGPLVTCVVEQRTARAKGGQATLDACVRKAPAVAAPAEPLAAPAEPAEPAPCAECPIYERMARDGVDDVACVCGRVFEGGAPVTVTMATPDADVVTVVPAAKAKRARKGAAATVSADPATGPDAPHTRVETMEDAAAMAARDDAQAAARESGAGGQRVVILYDSGNWPKARKGLAAWDAIKTPGAGSQSGGSCTPLVMLHTPAVDSEDAGKLLARLAKEKRRYLDMGVVSGSLVHDCAPSSRAVREQWNEKHPDARVEIGKGRT